MSTNQAPADAAVPEISGLDGPFPAGDVVIVASRYNTSICDSLVKGSLETLAEAGIDGDRVHVVRVPGAWELSLVAAQLLPHDDVAAVITLGCVIRGETTHDQHINRAVSDSLMQLSLQCVKPIGFGLLTCNTLEQALQRSGGNVGNKGHEAAEAALEMLRLQLKIA